MRRFFDITLEVLMKLKHASSLAVCVCYLTLQMKLPKNILVNIRTQKLLH